MTLSERPRGGQDSLRREQQLYDRVLTLTRWLDESRTELDEIVRGIRVAHLALERAERSRAWRIGRRVSSFLRFSARGRTERGADPLDAAAARLAALERDLPLPAPQ